MPFVKGYSGNPRGRPRLSEEEKEQRKQFKTLLKSATVPALHSIIDIARDKYSRDRFNACKYIIDKAYGSNTAILLDGTEETAPVTIIIKPYDQNDDEDEWEREWNEAPDNEEE